MVEVELGAFRGGQVAGVAVVGVVRQIGHPVKPDPLQDLQGYGRLAGTGAPATPMVMGFMALLTFSSRGTRISLSLV